MSDALFILTVVFVAYVIYTMVDEQRTTTKLATSEVKAEVKSAIETASEPQPPIEQTSPEPSNDVPVAEIKTSSARKKKPAPPPVAVTKHQIKNPKTGEITTTNSNYRFAKRWLKEALVSEKLLDKIYKNDELNEEIEAKIKDALVKLETIKKYKV